MRFATVIAALLVVMPAFWARGEIESASLLERAEKEYKQADDLLNKAYQQRVAAEGEQGRALVKTAQLAWLKYRDAMAESDKLGIKDEELAQAAALYSKSILTWKRTEELGRPDWKKGCRQLEDCLVAVTNASISDDWIGLTYSILIPDAAGWNHLGVPLWFDLQERPLGSDPDSIRIRWAIPHEVLWISWKVAGDARGREWQTDVLYSVSNSSANIDDNPELSRKRFAVFDTGDVSDYCEEEHEYTYDNERHELLERFVSKLNWDGREATVVPEDFDDASALASERWITEVHFRCEMRTLQELHREAFFDLGNDDEDIDKLAVFFAIRAERKPPKKGEKEKLPAGMIAEMKRQLQWENPELKGKKMWSGKIKLPAVFAYLEL